MSPLNNPSGSVVSWFCDQDTKTKTSYVHGITSSVDMYAASMTIHICDVGLGSYKHKHGCAKQKKTQTGSTALPTKLIAQKHTNSKYTVHKTLSQKKQTENSKTGPQGKIVRRLIN